VMPRTASLMFFRDAGMTVVSLAFIVRKRARRPLTGINSRLLPEGTLVV